MTQAQETRETLSVIGVICFLSWACQDYSFEETPKSEVMAQRWSKILHPTQEVDILFVIDNSGSMAGEQRQLAESFGSFVDALDVKIPHGYRIALVTTGMKSRAGDGVGEDDLGCPACDRFNGVSRSCVNETGETGLLQSRLGANTGSADDPTFDFSDPEPGCRVITAENKTCFFDCATQRGVVMVGTNGCGYERGLSAMKRALSSHAKGFLRKEATLAVILVSDEDDCGEPGDVTENLAAGGDICYYAAKGIDPSGNVDYVVEGKGRRPYRLTPVREYFDFLMELKDYRRDMIKFAAIVGVQDPGNPAATTAEAIAFRQQGAAWEIEPACATAGCAGQYCSASPGTRYVELAGMFGLGDNGFVATICQTQFTDTLLKIAEIIPCPREFALSEPLRDPALASILINGEPVPRTSCAVSGALFPCDEASDCPQGECVETWSHHGPGVRWPADRAPGGVITFAPHYDPCELFVKESVQIELVYIPDV